jgi:hypothetical protein
MNHPRRSHGQSHLWRWRLSLLFPMVLFGLLTARTLRDSDSAPYATWSITAVFFVIAMLFLLQLWREREPLQSEVRERPTLNDRSL